MGIPGDIQNELINALIYAFPNKQKLKMMLKLKLNFTLTIDSNDISEILFELIDNNQLEINRLIRGALRSNPNNKEIQNFVKNHIEFLGLNRGEVIKKNLTNHLISILEEIKNFDCVVNALKKILPDRRSSYILEDIKNLDNPRIDKSIKIFLILEIILKDYSYDADNQELLIIFVFIADLLANISDPQLQQKLKNWQDRARDQGYQLPKEKSSSTNNENKNTCTWQPYLSIVIKKLSSPDPDRYSLSGYLILENINNRNQKPDLIPLQNYIVVNNRKTDDNTTIPNYKSSKQFNFSFSQSKTEPDKKNLAKQLKILIEESYDKIRGIRERRISKNLIIEFFLPSKYLFENVDCWKIPYGIGCGEFIELGKKYNVIVRSYDRLNSSEFITILEQNWQKIEKIIERLQDDINEQELTKYHQTYYTNLNSMSGRGQKIATKMKSKIGLKLICKPPKSGESCSGLVNAILESGVPIIIWAKCQDIPDQNLFNKFNQFFAPKSIKKINNLANIVYEQRVKAFEAIDTLKNNQIEEEIKDIEKDSATEPDPNQYFGYYLTIYFEETNRLSKLHDYLKDNIQNNKLRLGA